MLFVYGHLSHRTVRRFSATKLGNNGAIETEIVSNQDLIKNSIAFPKVRSINTKIIARRMLGTSVRSSMMRFNYEIKHRFKLWSSRSNPDLDLSTALTALNS